MVTAAQKIAKAKADAEKAQAELARIEAEEADNIADAEDKEEQIGNAFGTLFSTVDEVLDASGIATKQRTKIEDAITTCRLHVRKIVLEPTDDDTEGEHGKKQTAKIDPKTPIMKKKQKQGTSTGDVLKREFPSGTSVDSQSSKKKSKVTNGTPSRTTRASTKKTAKFQESEDDDE